MSHLKPVRLQPNELNTSAIADVAAEAFAAAGGRGNLKITLEFDDPLLAQVNGQSYLQYGATHEYPESILRACNGTTHKGCLD